MRDEISNLRLLRRSPADAGLGVLPGSGTAAFCGAVGPGGILRHGARHRRHPARPGHVQVLRHQLPCAPLPVVLLPTLALRPAERCSLGSLLPTHPLTHCHLRLRRACCWRTGCWTRQSCSSTTTHHKAACIPSSCAASVLLHLERRNAGFNQPDFQL